METAIELRGEWGVKSKKLIGCICLAVGGVNFEGPNTHGQTGRGVNPRPYACVFIVRRIGLGHSFACAHRGRSEPAPLRRERLLLRLLLRGHGIPLSHKFYMGARIVVGFNLLEGGSALILLRSLGRVGGTRPLPRGRRSCFNFIPIRLLECGVGCWQFLRQAAPVVLDFAIPIPDRIDLNFRHRMESHIGT